MELKPISSALIAFITGMFISVSGHINKFTISAVYAFVPFGHFNEFRPY
jgi:hypothetical protein